MMTNFNRALRRAVVIGGCASVAMLAGRPAIAAEAVSSADMPADKLVQSVSTEVLDRINPTRRCTKGTSTSCRS